jgi:hypothetical protein
MCMTNEQKVARHWNSGEQGQATMNRETKRNGTNEREACLRKPLNK